MPVTSETRKAGPYIGDGIVTSYAFAYKVFTAGDVRVVRDGVDLALGSDYTVALNADQDAAPGGAVNLAAPLSSGASLEILSNVRPLQTLRLLAFGGFYPSALTDALDRLMICVQQLLSGLGISWAGIPDKPSTLAGYGVEAEADSRYLRSGQSNLTVATTGGSEATALRVQASEGVVDLVTEGDETSLRLLAEEVRIPALEDVLIGDEPAEAAVADAVVSGVRLGWALVWSGVDNSLDMLNFPEHNVPGTFAVNAQGLDTLFIVARPTVDAGPFRSSSFVEAAGQSHASMDFNEVNVWDTTVDSAIQYPRNIVALYRQVLVVS